MVPDSPFFTANFWEGVGYEPLFFSARSEAKFLKFDIIYRGKKILFQNLAFHRILDNFQKKIIFIFVKRWRCSRHLNDAVFGDRRQQRHLLTEKISAKPK